MTEPDGLDIHDRLRQVRVTVPLAAWFASLLLGLPFAIAWAMDDGTTNQPFPRELRRLVLAAAALHLGALVARLVKAAWAWEPLAPILGRLLAGYGLLAITIAAGWVMHDAGLHLPAHFVLAVPAGWAFYLLARAMVPRRRESDTPGNRLLAHSRDRPEYHMFVGVPPANPTRWVRASRVGDVSIDVRGAPAVKPSEVTAYFVTYPSGTLVDHRGPEHLPLPPWVTGLSVAAAAREHDALRPADLKEGQSIVRVTFGRSTGKPGSRDHYSTTLTNVSSRPVRVLKFAGYTRSGGVFVLNTVSGQFFTAAEFREWYGQSGEWIGPGESVADPNNYGSPPVLWAYYCEDEQGHAFVTGGIIE